MFVVHAHVQYMYTTMYVRVFIFVLAYFVLFSEIVKSTKQHAIFVYYVFLSLFSASTPSCCQCQAGKFAQEFHTFIKEMRGRPKQPLSPRVYIVFNNV